MERVGRALLFEYLVSTGLLDSPQHGSRTGRSTLSQLIFQYDRVLKLLQNGKNVDFIYLDFAKTIDKVDLGILVIKLLKLGIKGALLRLVTSFILEEGSLSR